MPGEGHWAPWWPVAGLSGPDLLAPLNDITPGPGLALGSRPPALPYGFSLPCVPIFHATLVKLASPQAPPHFLGGLEICSRVLGARGGLITPLHHYHCVAPQHMLC